MADRETRKKEITTKRQRQILDAATEVFIRKGFSAATIPEIAREAGVAAGTIYLYYPNKRDLFIASIADMMVIPLVTIFNRASGSRFPATIKEVLIDRLKFFQSDFLPKFLFLIGEIQRDPDLKKMFVDKLIHPFITVMEGMYRQRIESGEFRQMDPALIVRMIGGMMIGTTLLRGLEEESSPLNRLPQEQVADEIMNFILYGLMKRPDDNKRS